MIIKLLPDQIATYWDGLLCEAIEYSLPPTVLANEQSMLRILESLMDGKLEVWLITHEQEIGKPLKILGIGTTSIIRDDITGQYSLLIYSLYAIETIPLDILKGAVESIKKYAMSNGCEIITAYTMSDRVERMSHFLGAIQDDYHFLTFKLNSVNKEDI